MTARRASDDPRLPPLYEERDQLEGQAAAISRRLAEIQRQVLSILHPHGAQVTGRHPLHYRRSDDPKVPMPAQTAAALGLTRHLPHSDTILIEPQPRTEGMPLLVGLGGEAPEASAAAMGVGDDWHGRTAVGSAS